MFKFSHERDTVAASEWWWKTLTPLVSVLIGGVLGLAGSLLPTHYQQQRNTDPLVHKEGCQKIDVLKCVSSAQ
jgi:hypothetical protein